MAGGAATINTEAADFATSIGNTTGSSALTVRVGTGNFSLDGVAGSTYTIGASTTTGTYTVGGTAQSGTMTLGSSSGTNIVAIGAGEGATTVNIANGTTNAKTIALGIGAAMANTINIGGTGANVIAIGNTQTAGSLAIGAAMTTGTIAIGGTGLQTGTITIGGGTGAQTVNLGTGATGVKTIHIGDSAVANVITLGSTTGAASLTLQSGSGNIAHNAGFTVDSTGRNYNTVQPAFLYYGSLQSSVTGDGTAYTVKYANSKFDQGSNFVGSTGTFTAPITGKYLFQGIIQLGGLTALDTNVNYGVVTTANSFTPAYSNVGAVQSSGVFPVTWSLMAPMTAADTMTTSIIVSGSTKTVSILGGSTNSTFICGYLLC